MDLVVHDGTHTVANPFQELVPISGTHVFLRHIIVGVAAMHYSKLMGRNNPSGQLSDAALQGLVDALRERHKAIKALQGVFERRSLTEGARDSSDEGDALFATIVFFINFALIDSGKDGWRFHMRAAGRLIEQAFRRHTLRHALNKPQFLSLPDIESESNRASPSADLIDPLRLAATSPSALLLSSRLQQPTTRDCIISDFISYYIWSNALDSLTFAALEPHQYITSIDIDTESIRARLLRTEAIHYHSCPATLLLIIFRTSLVARDIISTCDSNPTGGHFDACEALLREAHQFDPHSWAAEVCARNLEKSGTSAEVALQPRTRAARAYRAATCLYVLLVAPGLRHHMHNRAMSGGVKCDSLPMLQTTEDFAATIMEQLTLLPSATSYFTNTSWPVFLLGLGTKSPARRAWVIARIQAIHLSCPWGMLETAIETLGDIWRLRDKVSAIGQWLPNGPTDDGTDEDWLVQLRGMKIDGLIV
jgi:hypothetical protein